VNRRVAAGALVTAALLAVAVPGGPAQADPSSIASAKAQAAALTQQVQSLQVQAEQATEQYDAVLEQLGDVVSRYLSASEHVGDLQQSTDALRLRKIQRVRALYMAGGQMGLYAQALDGASLSDVLSRVSAVTRVLDADTRAITAGDTATTRAEADAARLDQLAAERTDLEAQVRTAAARVRALLAARTQQLDTANATVRRLVAEEEARQAAEAAARAAQLMAIAQSPPVAMPAGTPASVASVIGFARTRLGLPYVWGATGPDTFDCSGLVQWAYAQAGLTLPRTSREQWWTGSHPTLDQLLPGDLLFWATDLTDPGSIHHVALYIGDGYMIEAPHPGAAVEVSQVYLDGYYGATRPAVLGEG
jgi:cell wall-associated NlpC family hydrolase